MKNPIPVLAIFILFFICVVSTSWAQTMKKTPYLIYTGTNTEMTVLWQLSAAGTDTIRWGTDQSYALGSAITTEYGTDHQHRFTITGLTPGAFYYYRVGITGGSSYAGSFHAAPSASDTTLKFITYGDVRTNIATHNQVANAILAAVAADPSYQTFLMVNGDLTASGDQESYWTNELFNNSYSGIRNLMASMPYQACLGNHEQSGNLFRKYFPFSFVGARYYSFDYGPLHVTVLDQYTSYTPGSAQLQWLEQDLAASLKPWKIVTFHEPGWTAGGAHINNTTVQTYVEPLCEKYNVPLVITGHNHYYARAVVAGANGDTVTHITTGGGGAPLYDPDPAQPNIVKVYKANHYCKISIVDNATLTLDAVALDGTGIETIAIHHHTPALTGIAATGLTYTGATIGWNTDVRTNGVIEFGRGPANGGSSFDTTIILAGDVSSHSYNLSGLQPGTFYHYRVHSENASSDDITFQTPSVPVQMVAISFQVNMAVAREKDLFLPDSGDVVVLTGPFNAWGDSLSAGDTLTDGDANNIYTSIRQFVSGDTVVYLFKKTLRGGIAGESFTRHLVADSSDTGAPVAWFNNDSLRPGVTVTMAPKWNIVSLPAHADVATPAAVFPMALTTAYRYDNGYHTADTLKFGVGYWMKFAADTAFRITGRPAMPDSIDLIEGWNLIGAPGAPLPVSALGTAPAGILVGAAWQFRNGYIPADTLFPGKGYWLRATSPGKLGLK